VLWNFKILYMILLRRFENEFLTIVFRGLRIIFFSKKQQVTKRLEPNIKNFHDYPKSCIVKEIDVDWICNARERMTSTYKTSVENVKKKGPPGLLLKLHYWNRYKEKFLLCGFESSVSEYNPVESFCGHKNKKSDSLKRSGIMLIQLRNRCFLGMKA
jgi:hypothetical protein